MKENEWRKYEQDKIARQDSEDEASSNSVTEKFTAAVNLAGSFFPPHTLVHCEAKQETQ